MVLFMIFIENQIKFKMNFTNELFLTLISVSPILIIVGFLILKFPPKSINSFIGYRTKQSKSSPDKWKFAQIYAAIQLMKSGLIGSLLAFGALFLESEGTTDVFIAIMIVLVLAFYPVFKTEKAMRIKFDKK